MKRLYIFLFSIVVSFIFFGCVPQNTTQIVEPQKIYNTYKKIENKPEDLHDLYVSYYVDEKRNSVLNLMQLGLYAFQKDYYKEAGSVFDKVLLHIESTHGEDSESEKAKSLWYGEDSKRFIGEPYERSMAYFYRGLLYLKAKDYENARASFKGGLLQDARSEDSQYQSDFRTLLLLDALSSRLNNEEGLYLDSLDELSKISVTYDVREVDPDTANDVTEVDTDSINDIKEYQGTGTHRVNYYTLSVRSNRSYGAKVVKVYSKNEIITVVENKDGWSRTNHGWVDSMFIEPIDKKTVKNNDTKSIDVLKYRITSNTLSIRSKPSLKAKKNGSYKKDELIEVIKREDNWSRTNQGWVFNKFIKLVNNEKSIKINKSSITQKSELGSYIITSNTLSIRSQPSLKAKKNGSYKKDELIEVIKREDNWSQTEKGWVFNKFIKQIEIEIEKKIALTNDNAIDIIKKSNFFLFIDSGNSPEKYTSGEYDAELNFNRNGYLIKPKISIEKKDSSENIILLDDLYFQASTRGGREIDKIIAGKVGYKDEATETAYEAGQTATKSFDASTSILSNYKRTGNDEVDGVVAAVGLTFAAIGLIAKGIEKVSEEVADSVVTKADARYWHNLPGGIYLYIDELKPGKYNVSIQAGTTTNIEVNIPDTKEIVVEHAFGHITKPSGIVDMYQINNAIDEKDKYQETYIKNKEKEESNENIKESIVNFFSTK